MPLGGSVVTGQHADSGGFSRSARSNESEYFPPGHLESYLVDNSCVVENFCQIMGLYDNVMGQRQPILLCGDFRSAVRAACGVDGDGLLAVWTRFRGWLFLSDGLTSLAHQIKIVHSSDEEKHHQCDNKEGN